MSDYIELSVVCPLSFSLLFSCCYSVGTMVASEVAGTGWYFTSTTKGARYVKQKIFTSSDYTGIFVNG